jgi:hypothetical protein
MTSHTKLNFYLVHNFFEYNPGSTPLLVHPPTPSATVNKLLLTKNASSPPFSSLHIYFTFYGCGLKDTSYLNRFWELTNDAKIKNIYNYIICFKILLILFRSIKLLN